MKELKEAIGSVSYKDLFIVNCMLMKDYIGTTEEIHKYLDHAIDINVELLNKRLDKNLPAIIAGGVNSGLPSEQSPIAKIF